MSVDIIAIKNHLKTYEPFSSNARLFAKFVAAEIAYDSSIVPITDLRQYLNDKLDFVKNSFDAYDYAPTKDLAGLTDDAYAKLSVYVRNMVSYITNNNGLGKANAPKERVFELLGFFDGIKTRPLREGQKDRHVVGFPAIANRYVNGEVQLTPDVVESLEVLALSGGRG